MSQQIICPSGLTGLMRGLKVREEKLLTDRKNARSASTTDRLLSACWEETLDPGPYDFADGKIDWDAVLIGDRVYAATQLYALTYGEIFEFSVTCREESCRSKIEWEVDLSTLPLLELSAESRLAFENGNRLETTIPGLNNRLFFRLLTGKDEKRFQQVRKYARGQNTAAMLAFKILEIEGVEEKEKRRFVNELSMGVARELLDEFDRHDCGVDTTIEVECPECFAAQEVELPFRLEPRDTRKKEKVAKARSSLWSR